MRQPRGSIIPVGAVMVVAQAEKPKEGKVDANTDPLRRGLLEAMPALANRAVSDPLIRIRLSAFDALDPLDRDLAPVVPVLVRAMADCNKFVRWAAARTVGKAGPVYTDLTVPPLVRLLSDIDLDVEIAAAATLGGYGPVASAAVPALAQAALKGDSERRVAAIHALAAMGADAIPAIPALVEALNNNDARVLRAAADALGPMGPEAKAAIPGLEKRLNDTDPEVRKAVADALLAITAGK
jgi:HEAT repeat protein